MTTMTDQAKTAPTKAPASKRSAPAKKAPRSTRARRPEHLTMAERMARGEEARYRTPPTSHAGWAPESDRPDPVALLEEQNTTRDPDLVPVRHGRMMASPFTFYRGRSEERRVG